MKITFSSKSVFAAMTLPALLTACGGGGGSSNDTTENTQPTRTSISESQAYPVAKSIVTDSVELLGAMSSGPELLASGMATIQSALGSTHSSKNAVLENATLKVMRFVRDNKGPAMVSGVTEDVACSGGGTLRVVINEKNPEAYTAGDSLAVTSQNCFMDGNRLVGSFSLTISAVRGDPYSTTSVWGLTLATNYSSFGALDSTNSGASITGSLTLTLDENPTASAYTLSATGGSLKGSIVDQGSVTETSVLSDFNLKLAGDSAKDTLSINGNVVGKTSSLGDYSYNLATPLAFTILSADMNPSSGQLLITGSNATVTVKAISNTTVQIDYTDAAGTKSQTKTWDEFNA